MRRGVELEHDIEVAAQQRGRHVGGGAERHDLHLDAGDVLEQLGGEILRAAGIDGADVELAGIGLRRLDDVLQDSQSASRPSTTISRSKNDTVEVEAKSLRMS